MSQDTQPLIAKIRLQVDKYYGPLPTPECPKEPFETIITENGVIVERIVRPHVKED